jgi:hypothetical protein
LLVVLIYPKRILFKSHNMASLVANFDFFD